MNHKSLILNVTYMPLSIINADRAFVLWYKDRVDILNHYKNEYFKTVNDRYKIPSVVKIREYVNYRYDNVPFTKSNILRRDRYECVYCGSKRNLTIDHVIPTSKGGKDNWLNVVTACQSCNSEKSDLTENDLPPKFRKDLKLYRPHAFLMMKNMIGDIPEEWKPYLFY